MRIDLRTRVTQPYLEVKAGFTEELFKALNPPFPPVKLLRFDGSSKGDLVTLELNFIFFKQTWTSEIIADQTDEQEFFFIDAGRKLPFFLKDWRHKHRVVNLGETHSLIVDEIDYTAPNSLLGLLLYPVLYLQFALRKPVYKRYFTKKNSNNTAN
jgi:ligand-binding SRPBCC domain-containing protein